MRSRLRRLALAAAGLGLSATLYGGCKEAKEEIRDTFGTDVTGLVNDDKGQPVEGATVKLYSLLENTNFVEGSDIRSAEAYIDRERVLASNNTVATATTGADGRFKMKTLPSAFLAVVTKEGCSAGFAGFDEETGVLNVDTLITPNFEGSVNFEIPTLVIACAAPPPVVDPDEGNTPDAPPYDPPVTPPPACDAAACAAAGGACQGPTCVITCVPADCTAAGGTCTGGVCVAPGCVPATCQAAGGQCSGDGNTCELPKCDSDEDCQVVQPGSTCVNPGDVALAECKPPEPGEIPAPPQVAGWVELRLTDTKGQPLIDASAADQALAAATVPADGLVRLYARYMGPATKGYVLVQSGSPNCVEAPPRTDSIPMDLSNQQVATAKGDFLELYLHKGFQKIQLSTSETIGEGERSHSIEIGARCTPPASPFTATLTWDAGPGQPADLDLNVWNAAGELVFVGKKQAAWGQLKCHGKGPGPEVFESTDVAQGPYTIKVVFFSGKPRNVEGKLRITRTVAGKPLDDTYTFTVDRPKDVAEIGVFASQ
ncbi:MAG TPA: hypothetical protein VFS43_18080 [Polyangiaceae bacterium]|nr:hypothetical protein [Polyangiaceae bacterium]